MSPEKQTLIDATIAQLEEAGLPVSNEAVYRVVGGNRGNLVAYMKAWRAQRRGDGVVAVLDGASPDEDEQEDAPVPPPQPILVRLAAERTQIQRDLEAVQQRISAHAHALHEAQYTARTALERLRRTSRVLRVAPWHQVQAAIADRERAEQWLARFVGQEEARRAAHDLAYVPRGL